MNDRATTSERIIKATPAQLYHAFTDRLTLEKFLAPGAMTAHVNSFDLRVGGSYNMSLFYPASSAHIPGKTTQHEDRFTSTFLELEPFKKIKTATFFDSEDDAFAGEMFMTVTFTEVDNTHTNVKLLFENIPAGISLSDNQLGTELTLNKLQKLFNQQS